MESADRDLDSGSAQFARDINRAGKLVGLHSDQQHDAAVRVALEPANYRTHRDSRVSLVVRRDLEINSVAEDGPRLRVEREAVDTRQRARRHEAAPPLDEIAVVVVMRRLDQLDKKSGATHFIHFFPRHEPFTLRVIRNYRYLPHRPLRDWIELIERVGIALVRVGVRSYPGIDRTRIIASSYATARPAYSKRAKGANLGPGKISGGLEGGERQARSSYCGALGIGLVRGRQEDASRQAKGDHVEKAQARRPDSRRQKAVVNRDEEALGRTQEDGFVANCSNRREDIGLRCARELAAPIGGRRLHPPAS